MGKKLDHYIAMRGYIKQLDNLLEERIKEGNDKIWLEWTSDGTIQEPGECGMVSLKPDGSQTFTFKFGPDYGKS